MKRKLITGILALTMTVGTLAGCGTSQPAQDKAQQEKETGKTEETKAGDAGAGEKKQLTFWIRGSETDGICKALQEDIDAYNALEDGSGYVKVEYVPLGDFATKFNAAFAGGTAPDIVETGADQISIRAHMSQYLALDDYLDSWENKDQIVESYLDAGKMLDDGKTYALAYAPTPCVFAWRKDFFEEAGLDPEKPPKDWDEMLEYAKKLVVKDGDTVTRGGFTLEPADHRLFTLMARQAGCSLYDPETNMPQMAGEEGVRTLQYFMDIQPYSILYNPAPGANTLLPFLTSESAMAYVTTEEISTMIANDPSLEDKIGVSSYVPAKDGADSTWCGYRLLAINAAAKDPDVAWEVISYLMTEDANRNRMEANVPPAYKSLCEEYEKRNEKINVPAVAAIGVGEPFPKTDWMASYAEAVRNALQETLYGEKSAEQALADAENLIKTDANLQ